MSVNRPQSVPATLVAGGAGVASEQTATLGGGCFWCLEAVYQEMEGVRKVVSGYMGGQVAAPTYQQVCSGTTGHVEVTQVTFDTGTVSYPQILEVFFAIHDPTSRDRQGDDSGPQYRSVIFYHDEAQRAAAEAAIAALTAEHAYSLPIVTEVRPATTFYPAEDYHQQYFTNHPNQPYCTFVVSPKVRKFRQKFAARTRRGD
ncbi:MAG: peptide-methionine (S)-S-oxide reductase MsrA [Bryobacteraceae bacterium]